MKSLFPQTLEAAMAADKSLWKLGDALVAETDGTLNGKRGLKAAAEELTQYGIEYTYATLSEIRTAADAFPPNRRKHKVAFTTYTKAGNPDTLDVIMEAAAKSGVKKVTQPYVEATIAAMRQQARDEREKATAIARREKEKADAEEEAARKREASAKDKSERQQAERDRRAATERRRKAAENLKKAKSSPKKKDRQPPTVEDVPLLALASSLIANADEATRLAVKNKKLIGGDNLAELSPKAINAIVEAALEAMNEWKRFADEARKTSRNKRGHLSVVA